MYGKKNKQKQEQTQLREEPDVVSQKTQEQTQLREESVEVSSRWCLFLIYFLFFFCWRFQSLKAEEQNCQEPRFFLPRIFFFFFLRVDKEKKNPTSSKWNMTAHAGRADKPINIPQSSPANYILFFFALSQTPIFMGFIIILKFSSSWNLQWLTQRRKEIFLEFRKY